jgi:hypothetical protein
MTHQEWRRVVEDIADGFDATVEDRGAKLVILVPSGGSVFVSKTPSRPAPDQVRRDVRRQVIKSRSEAR